MNKTTAVRAAFAVIIFVVANLQAWDSNAYEAGLLIALLVSLAISLPPVVVLLPVKPPVFVGVLGVSLVFLILARLIAPTPLPGLFLVLIPAAMALIFSGIYRPADR